VGLLEKINSPDDLKQIEYHRLPDIASEIRDLIIDVVSKNGGHLASSLGTVELTIALHRVYNFGHDKLIWDVGHQSYAHKILTGRKDRFSTLRKHKGLSGFNKISESPYDAFTVGHSSTSISAGFGMASANCINKTKKKIVTVIGDGSLTAGIAFEALNQAGHTKKDQLVILNDNDMSISKNVGALSSFLSRKLSKSYLQGLREEIKDLLKSLPGIGGDMYDFAKRSENSFKAFVTPGMLFQAFDFEYYGPIDGHNLDHLIKILDNIKVRNKPVLLHIVTKKGKGYKPAEDNPVYFHGVGSFDKITGSSSKKKKRQTYTHVFGQTLTELAEKDKRIVAVTAAMPEGTGLNEFSKKFPERFFDVGIAEQHGVTFSAGLALEGLKPVVAIYSTFLQRAYDQILHDICLENIPVTFAIDRGGIVGEDGPTHHGLFDYSFLRPIPNMIIMAPKDENELKHMLYTAIEYKGPAAVRYPRGSALGVEMSDNLKQLEIGKAEIIKAGKDVTLLAVGSGVQEAVKASEILENEGISVTVVNMRFIKPLDTDLLKKLSTECTRFVTIEENMKAGGFGSAVLEALNDLNIYDVHLKRIGIEDQFVEHGPQNLLRNKYGLNPEAIVLKIKELMN